MKKLPPSILIIFCAAGLFFRFVLAAEVVDRVMAIVGSEMITLSDVRAYSSQKGSHEKIPGVDTKDPLESLINEKLLKQEMERLGITATDEDVNTALRDMAARNKVSVDILKAELSKKGIPFDKFKANIGNQIRQMKFMGQVIYPRIKVSDRETTQKTKKAAGEKTTDEAQFRAKMEILQSRAPEEISKYLEEVRAKSYVQIKK